VCASLIKVYNAVAADATPTQYTHVDQNAQVGLLTSVAHSVNVTQNACTSHFKAVVTPQLFHAMQIKPAAFVFAQADATVGL
jgi:hypothetical protein